MSEACRARLTLACQIAPAYAANPAVAAVLVGGSVAWGYADQWSDLELGVVWSAEPTEESRATAATAAGAASRRVFPDATSIGAREEEFEVSGVKVDVVHLTVTTTEQVLVDVTERADPALAKQVLVGALRCGIPLHGVAHLEGWQTRAAAYPDALARAMVEQQLRFGPHAWLKMLAERDDLLLLYGTLCHVERAVLGVLLGLNRVYPASADFKWSDQTARALTIAPAGLAGRLRRLFRAEPREGVAEAIGLIDETVDLVETHLPTLDTGSVRARLRKGR